MTDLREHTLFLRLTPEGIGALRGLISEGETASVHVVAEKPYGLWVVPDRVFGESTQGKDEEVVLLKWSHFSTATFMRPRGEERRPLAGRKG